ncbi:MAG: prepilin peptidase [Henriciella sp.]
MILSVFAICFFGLCLLAALIDVETLTIPNWLNGWLAFLFIPACIVAAPGWEVAGMHLLVGAIAFVISVMLFTIGVYGGGDAKMIPAVVLWIGPDGVLDFLINTAFAGGALTILVVIGRALLPAQVTPGFGVATLKEGKGVPYAVAIAVGAFMASPHSPMLANFFN